jgi:hypothetical protein
MHTSTHQKGELINVGEHNLGIRDRFTYFLCVDCETAYPMIGGQIMCNGKGIIRCLCSERKEGGQ